MWFFKNRKPRATTRIVKHIHPVPDTAPQQAIVSTELTTQRRDILPEGFQGFNSPPGRF